MSIMTSAGSSSSSSLAALIITFLVFLQTVLVLVVCVEVDDDVFENETESLTPEDVRFATLRCQNDSTNDPSMRLQWSLRMFPDNHETHCYIKCILSKLGLINLKYRGLDSNKFVQPLESQDIEVSENCFSKLDEDLSGTCEGYYRKWMDLRSSCKDLFYISLYEDPREVEKQENSNITQGKKVGESATEFCSKRLLDSQNKELTSAESIDSDMLSVFKCELGCVFRHIRYFDVYGRVDKNEILRSFEEANSNSKSNTSIVTKCVHRANSLYAYGNCQMAYELYQCLLKKVKNFKEIYAKRDKISEFF